LITPFKRDKLKTGVGVQELFAGPGNVHFKNAGSEKIAEQVAEWILRALKQKEPLVEP
jgi:hypothetical protein